METATPVIHSVPPPKVSEPVQGDDPKKPCKVCAERIEKAAIKCIHCGSWQKDRGEFLAALNISLPIGLAFLSVCIAALPYIASALTPKKSVLNATFQNAYGYHISSLASNDGGRPGTLRGASVGPAIPEGTKSYWIADLEPVTSDLSAAALVEPGHSTIVVFRVEGLYFHFDRKHLYNNKDYIYEHVPLTDEALRIWKAFTSLDKPNCQIDYHFTNFDGKPVDTHEKIACLRLSRFISAAQEHSTSADSASLPNIQSVQENR